MKYIDAEKLKTEIINRMMSVNLEELGNFGCHRVWAYNDVKDLITSLQQEQTEMDIEKFTEKMDAWKSRYNHPDNIPIKASMAFTARMFYQYPNVARQWYEQLPKATMDNTKKED